MKAKRLFQIFILLTLLLSPFANVSASTNSVDQVDAMIVNRSLNYWDATYFGFVSSSIFENWQFEFAESHNFVVTVTPISGDLLPQLSLLDTGGNTLATGGATLTSTQPAGNYSIQVQPASGSGFYMLTIREIIVTQPSVTTSVSPSSINAGETATVTVSLNNVPAEGYTSAEFTCTYDASLVQVSNIAVTNLFGADAAVAINDPQNGSFIVAIAGSNGNKATTSGSAFTFSATGLQAGQSAIECTVRVSKGDNSLTSLSSTGTSLTVVGSLPTATFTPTPIDTTTPTSSTPVDTATPTSSTPVDTATPTSSTPVDTATPTSSTPVDTATPTSSTPVDTATATSSTPVESPTPTTVPDGSLTGQVLAGKPITVGLYSGTTLVTSVTANNDGTFSLTAPAGSYTVLATSSGFLSAQGSATIVGGSTNTKPTVTLQAGDIDGNNVIDQFDALTIGMNYNAATPPAADLNNDGVINVLDLELLADHYRATGSLAWE
jgi:hypothetical protein